jgi:hypothetical protein
MARFQLQGSQLQVQSQHRHHQLHPEFQWAPCHGIKTTNYIDAPEQDDDDGPPSAKSWLRDNSFSEQAVGDKFGIFITKGDCGSGFEHNDLDNQQLTLSTTVALPVRLTVRGPAEAKFA